MGLTLPTMASMRVTAGALEIPLKDAQPGRWELYPTQEKVAEHLCAGRSCIVLKLRQEGITSVCLLWLMLLALLNPRQRFLIVLQGDDEAKEQLEIVKGWLGQIGLDSLDVSQAHKVRLPNGSEIHAKTSHGGEAEGKETKKGRSGAYAAALLSEAAYYRNDKALGAIKAAVGRGPIVVESTASGPDGIFATLWHDDPSPYAKVFIGVEDSSRCVEDPDSITDDEWRALQAEHGFRSRPHGAYWLHELRAVGGDVLSMKREYPVKPEDPFQASEAMWIQSRPTVMEPVRVTPTLIQVYEERHPEHPHKARYILTSDVAEGVGGDFSVWWAIERRTEDIVAGWWSNTDETDILSARIDEGRKMYGTDINIIERNGVGVGAVKESRRLMVPVLDEWAKEDEKYDKLLAAKRYVDERAAAGKPVPPLLLEEAKSLRAKPTKRGKVQWIGRKDGLIALGQGLEWIRLNPWEPVKQISEEQYYVAKALQSNDGYYR